MGAGDLSTHFPFYVNPSIYYDDMLTLKEGSLLQRSVSYLFGQLEELKTRSFGQRLTRMQAPPLGLEREGAYRFKHSGNAGDIIYALPAMFALSRGSDVELFLKLNVPARYGKNVHPLGDVTLNERMFTMLKPLLMTQPSVRSCEIYTSQEVEYDLDYMRAYPFPLHAGHIARWYFLTFAASADLGQPWLTVDADPAYADQIVIARSQRYRAPTIDYSFLSRYGRITFVGIEAEYREMRAMIPTLQYRPVDDFLEMARVIRGSKLFIGNQSFPFSMAEAMKATRMLEVCHLCPNVIVEGPGGHDFCYQPQFEHLVRKLMN